MILGKVVKEVININCNHFVIELKKMQMSLKYLLFIYQLTLRTNKWILFYVYFLIFLSELLYNTFYPDNICVCV